METSASTCTQAVTPQEAPDICRRKRWPIIRSTTKSVWSARRWCSLMISSSEYLTVVITPSVSSASGSGELLTTRELQSNTIGRARSVVRHLTWSYLLSTWLIPGQIRTSLLKSTGRRLPRSHAHTLIKARACARSGTVATTLIGYHLVKFTSTLGTTENGSTVPKSGLRTKKILWPTGLVSAI